MAGRAAIEASRCGVRVAMVMKREFGKSGTSAAKVAEAAGYNVADGLVDPEDNPEEHYKDILAAAAGTCDERLARIVAEDAPETLRELERMGAPFHMDGDRYLEVVGCFASRPRMRRNKRRHLLRTDPGRNLLSLRGTADRATIECMRD